MNAKKVLSDTNISLYKSSLHYIRYCQTSNEPVMSTISALVKPLTKIGH